MCNSASVLNAAAALKERRELERLSRLGSNKGLMRSICIDVCTFNDLLYRRYEVKHTLPENERRFAEKYNEYHKDGYISLINKNLGNKNATVCTDETEQLLNNIFAEPSYKPTYTEVFRQYNHFLNGYIEVVNSTTGEVYDPAAFRPLSKTSIYNYLSKWQNRLATHTVRSADRQKNMTLYKPAFSFEQPQYAGSLLSIDDRQPPFKYGSGDRVWFYLAEDVASQAVTVWVHGKTKEGMILDFYRQLVRNYHEWGLNLPAELEAESNLNSSYKDTFLKQGNMFQFVRIEANNARGKAVESQVNRQLRYQFEKMEAGWQGRPFAQDESNQPSPTRDKIDRTYNQIVEMCLGKIEEFNNSPHPREKGVSKWEYFLENQNPNLKPTNYRGFIRQLGYHTETSVNVGNIRLNNELYLLGTDGQIATGDTLISLMQQVEGKDIDVYWLDANNGTMLCAYIYLRGQDRFICEAIEKPRPQRARAEQAQQDRDLHQLYAKYVATVEGYNKSQRKALDPVVILKTDKEPENAPREIFKINGKGGTTTKRAKIEATDVEILPPPPDEFETNFETQLNGNSTLLNNPYLDSF
jgi:hypothetical protein